MSEECKAHHLLEWTVSGRILVYHCTVCQTTWEEPRASLSADNPPIGKRKASWRAGPHLRIVE